MSEGVNEGIERFLSENTYAFYTSRDNHVIKLIKDGRAFTRRQIEQILIVNRKSSKRITQRILKRLYEQERIKKRVYAPQLPTVYYVDKPKHIEHALLINEVYCSLIEQRLSLYKVEWHWNYNVLNGMAIADALIIIHTGKNRIVVFLEVERNPLRRFDKDAKYEAIYDADWINEEWSVIKNNTAIFPAILIVTDEQLEINSGLNFIVASIDQIRKDIYSVILRR